MKRYALLLGILAAVLLTGLGFSRVHRRRAAEPPAQPRAGAQGWSPAYQYRQGQPIHWRHWLLKR
jgi:hypothetical protein